MAVLVMKVLTAEAAGSIPRDSCHGMTQISEEAKQTATVTLPSAEAGNMVTNPHHRAHVPRAKSEGRDDESTISLGWQDLSNPRTKQ